MTKKINRSSREDLLMRMEDISKGLNDEKPAEIMAATKFLFVAYGYDKPQIGIQGSNGKIIPLNNDEHRIYTELLPLVEKDKFDDIALKMISSEIAVYNWIKSIPDPDNSQINRRGKTASQILALAKTLGITKLERFKHGILPGQEKEDPMVEF